MNPFTKPKRSRITLTTGTRQLGVQLALEITWCLAASHLASFTPTTMVMSSFFAGAEVGGGLLPVGEAAGRLEHEVYPEILPRELGGIPFGEHLDGLAIDVDAVGGRPGLAGVPAPHPARF